MTEQWEPIRRIGTPKIDAAAPGLCNVRVTLAITPPSDWRQAFLQFENGIERTTFMFDQNPTVVGDVVSLPGARESDVEFWMRLIDAKIAGANVHYTEQTLPALAAAREREAAENKRHAEAQVRADEIAQRFAKP